MKLLNNKKRHLLGLLFLAVCISVPAQWKMQGNGIKTAWATQVSPQNTSKEYPRPILQRKEWKSLDGLWNYAIRKRGEETIQTFDGQILVPFAVESSLSGVMKTVGKDQVLLYQRTFDVPKRWTGKHVLLHFGAVDWLAEVYLNDIKIGEHKGGFTGFSFDITPYMNRGGSQKLSLRVWDPTTDGYQPVGKQSTTPNGIWYTPVTGIWQTVWLEPVSEQHVTAIRTTSDIDNNRLSIAVQTEKARGVVEVSLLEGNKVIETKKSAAGQSVNFQMDAPKLWSPESPYLYDLKIRLLDKGQVVDELTSYAAMRKISTRRDAHGIMRIQLNNKDLFQFGPLDQGYWPDGLYTAPCDEALKYDIELTKKLGFNMIRKHMKVEPARWYSWCDKLGILVWQDMPSGDKSPQWQAHQYFDGAEIHRSATSEANFRQEWKDIIDELKPYPSIVVWTPFNEAWGQFKSTEIAEWTKQYDTTRLVNPASGGNHYLSGDMLDLHNYPEPKLYLYDANRPTVLGEYGGLGLPVKGHLWQDQKNWGYVEFKNSKEVTDRYVQYTKQLCDLVKSGFSAAVYTQTTDVEGEVNGLVTYDRKVLKVDENRVRKANQRVCKILDNNK